MPRETRIDMHGGVLFIGNGKTLEQFTQQIIDAVDEPREIFADGEDALCPSHGHPMSPVDGLCDDCRFAKELRARQDAEIHGAR